MIFLLLQRAVYFKDKLPKMDRDITGLTGCLGKTEKFLFSILSLIIYPYCPLL